MINCIRLYRLYTSALVFSLLTSLGTQAEVRSFLGVNEISINSAEGSLRFEKSTGNEFSIDYTKKNYSERCSFNIDQDSAKVQISISKPLWKSFSVACEVDMLVRVPEGAALVANLANGKMFASSLSGPTRLAGANIDIDLHGEFKRIAASSTSGQIVAKNFLARESSLRTIAGSIDVEVEGRKSAALLLRTVSGNAYVSSELPSEVEFSSVSGALHREGTKAPNNQRLKVNFDSVSGSLFLK